MNQYTFDGCGINGPDEFKTQVLTIAKREQRNNPEVVAFCNKAAAAEEMLAALEYITNWNSLEWDAEKGRDMARSAIRKAKGNP